MRERLVSLSRLLKVQAELQKLEEQNLARLKNQEAALGKEREELLQALDTHTTLYGAFIYPMAKRLRAVDVAEAAVKRDQDRVSRQLLDRAKQRKHVERLHAGMAWDWEREEEKRRLMDLMERAATKTSLP